MGQDPIQDEIRPRGPLEQLKRGTVHWVTLADAEQVEVRAKDPAIGEMGIALLIRPQVVGEVLRMRTRVVDREMVEVCLLLSIEMTRRVVLNHRAALE